MSEEQNFQRMITEINDQSKTIQEFSESATTSLPSLNQTTTSTQSQANSSIIMQTSSCQPLQKQVLNAFEAGLSIGIHRRLSDDNQQTQLILQSNQIGK